MTFPDLLRVAAMVFLGVTSVVLGDTAAKLLSAEGVEPMFVAWSRFALGAAILLPVSGMVFSELRLLVNRWILLRAMLIVCGVSCMLIALKFEPIANVFGAFFVGPIVSVVLAVLFLGERPSLGKSVLLMLGFGGVMLVAKPGFGMTVGLGFAVAGGCFYGSYLAVTKRVASMYRPRLLLMSQLMIGAVVLLPVGVSAPWPTPELSLWALVLASAFGSAFGNYLLVLANRRADASLIAPLVYSQLLSATVIGGVVFFRVARSLFSDRPVSYRGVWCGIAAAELAEADIHTSHNGPMRDAQAGSVMTTTGLALRSGRPVR